MRPALSARIYRLVTAFVTALSAMSYAGTGWAADGPPPGFEIKNENALLNLSGIPNAPTQLPAAALFTVGGAGNPNQAFQWWWWYRLPGGTRELAVNGVNPVWTPNAQGNMVSAPFALSPTLASTMEWTIFGLGNRSAMLNGILTVKNNGLAPIALDVFNYLDLDLGGTKADDGATREAQGQPRLLIGDPNWVARYRGIALGFFAFQSDAFPGVRDMLTDTDKDDFTNVQAIFEAKDGDWTGGFEWQRTIAAGATAGFSVTVEIGPRPAPEPGTLWMLGLGLVATALAHRRNVRLRARA